VNLDSVLGMGFLSLELPEEVQDWIHSRTMVAVLKSASIRITGIWLQICLSCPVSHLSYMGLRWHLILDKTHPRDVRVCECRNLGLRP
jgi:hypothetical protein